MEEDDERFGSLQRLARVGAFADAIVALDVGCCSGSGAMGERLVNLGARNVVGFPTEARPVPWRAAVHLGASLAVPGAEAALSPLRVVFLSSQIVTRGSERERAIVSSLASLPSELGSTAVREVRARVVCGAASGERGVAPAMESRLRAAVERAWAGLDLVLRLRCHVLPSFAVTAVPTPAGAEGADLMPEVFLLGKAGAADASSIFPAVVKVSERDVEGAAVDSSSPLTADEIAQVRCEV